MKIYIVGAVASGKSTLARELSGVTGIPYTSLDEVVHIPDKSNVWGNRKRQVDERDRLFNTIISQKDWLIEDTGRACFEEAFKAADSIVLIELPPGVRNYRIMKRWIKQRIGIEKCSYTPSVQMLKSMFKWSKEYEIGRDGLKLRLSTYKNKVILLRNNKDIKEFLNSHKYA